MKEEKLFESMANIDENYVAEAHNAAKRRKQPAWTKWVAIAASLLLVISGINVISHLSSKEDINFSLQVQAAEIGKEYMHFGATMPRIINVTDEKVIMYDYIGIWVYDMKMCELVGFCDFRPINMTRIQGDPYVVVESTSDGKYVKFYMSDESIKYLYDVDKNDYEQVKQYDFDNETLPKMSLSEEKQLSDCSETYILEDGTYISYTLDFGDDASELTYGDLLILTEKDGVNCSYRPFSTKSTI